MCKVLIFGGTTEGRLLAEFCQKMKVETLICAATEYGASLLLEDAYLSVSKERLDCDEMKALIDRQKPCLVVDATHPFALEVTANIKEACLDKNVQLLRVLRTGENEEGSSETVYVDTIEEAVEYLEGTEGNILVTTGSKELKKYTKLSNYENRIIARVLSTAQVAKECEELGFCGKNLVLMQGPFSKDLNLAMINQYDCKYLVTKASGNVGGFEDKIRACEEGNTIAVVIGRPTEKGISFHQCKKVLCDKFSLKPHKSVGLVGIGMGAKDSMTYEANEFISKADLLIGAKRMVDSVSSWKQEKVYLYASDQIIEYIDNHPEFENIAIVFSGDIGFYSGAKKLIPLLRERKCRISFIPGISSGIYFMDKIGHSWENALFASNHGKKTCLIPLIRDNEKVFSILGTRDGVQKLAADIIDYGFTDITMYVGENLSYPDEKISMGSPNDFLDYETSTLSVVMIRNLDYRKTKINPYSSRRDEEFIRGNVPMTKEEIRTISLSKLAIEEDSICYDIGAGTGSISIEMAIKAKRGMVYAVEVKDKAISLINENKKRFKTENLEIICGLAPEAMEELPAPTHVFIGGSSGNLDEIVDLVFKKNPKATIVINAIALETLSKAITLAKEYGQGKEEIVQLSVGRAKILGRYHMMEGENPISIICIYGSNKTLSCDEEE